jgi:hypothetical protein
LGSGNTETGWEITDDPNREADLAIFVISQGRESGEIERPQEEF